jgi:hypothetical protein
MKINVYLKFQGMKKMLVLLMVMVATSTLTFAINPADYKVFYKLNDQSTFKGLVEYLQADQGQADYLKRVFHITAENLQSASKADNEKWADSVINYNLYNAKCILSDNQYKKYLIIMNLTLNETYNENALISENK